MENRKLDEINKQMDIIWLMDPRKYEYVRESEYDCASPLYKPIKKGETTLMTQHKETSKTLIGYQKPVKVEKRLYHGKYWWLKGYDQGMPDNNGTYAPGKPQPTEAVKFI